MSKPKRNTEEYYVLIEDCEPYGPYPTQEKAEQSIIDRNREAFSGACRCLQQDADSWSEEVNVIVKVVRRVTADIKYTVGIKDA